VFDIVVYPDAQLKQAKVYGTTPIFLELLQACGQIWRPAEQAIRAESKSVVFRCRGKTHRKYPARGWLAATVRMRTNLWWEMR
jgi:hypothetical protein